MLSDYSGIRDEGLRNIAFYLSRELSQRHELFHLCLRPLSGLCTPGFWRKIRAFQPQIIHFIPGPTIKSFMMVKALKINCLQAKTVMSATHPALSSLSKRFVPWLKPDLILVQSRESEAMFAQLGCKTRFLPSGVDTGRFLPVSEEEKKSLRRKYHLDEKKWIVLHVGPLKRGRNVLFLNRIQQEENTQVLIVGSLSVPMEQGVYHSLLKGGCQVWPTYFENIAEIYALSDCYIFPTVDKLNSIELPLSVLEAMSCNLPVLTTPFRALPDVFAPGDGLSFAPREEDFVDLFNEVKRGGVVSKTREKVLSYSWEGIARRLEQFYYEVT